MASKTAAKGRAKGEGAIIKKANRFYLRRTENGKRTYELLRDKDGHAITEKTKAEEAARKLNDARRKLDEIQDHKTAVEAIAEDRKLIASLTTSPADIWEKFLSSPTRPQDTSEARRRDQKLVIDRLVNWCSQQETPITSMSDITGEALSKFLTDVYGDLSGRSYGQAITILRHVFKHTYKAFGLDANPADELEGKALKTKSRKEFTAEQVQAIFKGFDDGFFFNTEVVRMTTGRKHERVEKRMEYRPEYPRQFRLLILLMTFTGCRCGDACGMTWDCVNLATNTITFKPHKTAESSGVIVSLPLHQMLRDGLLEAQAWKRDGYILPDVANRYSYNRTGIYKTIQKIVYCATGVEITMKSEDSKKDENNNKDKDKKKSEDSKKDEEVKATARNAAQYGAHSFRHSFVSFCASAGVPLAIVQQIVGHGSPAMTEHYFNASHEAKQAAIEALPDMGADVPQQPKDITDDATRMKCKDMIDALPIEAVREIMEKYGDKVK
jgi:integrase